MKIEKIVSYLYIVCILLPCLKSYKSGEWLKCIFVLYFVRMNPKTTNETISFIFVFVFSLFAHITFCVRSLFFFFFISVAIDLIVHHIRDTILKPACALLNINSLDFSLTRNDNDSSDDDAPSN